MTILPAIDLKGGKCVRLRMGVASDSTIYGDDPVEMALRWEREGGDALHVVDLDGAFAGHPVHTHEIAAIAAALRIPVEVGGGLRTDDDVKAILDCGAARAIIGTRAISDSAALERLIAAYGSERIVVGVDARNGMAQANGWVDTSSVRATELARRMVASGVVSIIYTDTATDGMLTGPNLDALAEMADAVPKCAITASGGVSSAEDVAAIDALRRPNITGVIIGKALYDGRVTIRQLKS